VTSDPGQKRDTISDESHSHRSSDTVEESNTVEVRGTISDESHSQGKVTQFRKSPSDEMSGTRDVSKWKAHSTHEGKRKPNQFKSIRRTQRSIRFKK
jgi:hypothetical protein